jgi:hypothetical protein
MDNASYAQVTAIFGEGGGVKPTTFRVGQSLHRVENISLQHCVRKGVNKTFTFNVSAQSGDWVLLFDTSILRWSVAQTEVTW